MIAHDTETGWLLWVPSDPEEWDKWRDEREEPLVPAEVLRIQCYARHLGCDYVRFDGGAAYDSNLPTWSW